MIVQKWSGSFWFVKLFSNAVKLIWKSNFCGLALKSRTEIDLKISWCPSQLFYLLTDFICLLSHYLLINLSFHLTLLINIVIFCNQNWLHSYNLLHSNNNNMLDITCSHYICLPRWLWRRFWASQLQESVVWPVTHDLDWWPILQGNTKCCLLPQLSIWSLTF